MRRVGEADDEGEGGGIAKGWPRYFHEMTREQPSSRFAQQQHWMESQLSGMLLLLLPRLLPLSLSLRLSCRT